MQAQRQAGMHVFRHACICTHTGTNKQHQKKGLMFSIICFVVTDFFFAQALFVVRYQKNNDNHEVLSQKQSSHFVYEHK